jgi:glycosyltransferase involved in cell wall biosynthesis
VRRIDARPIPDQPGEIRAVMIVRNELLRLEANLRHHRDLGVDRFFVIDNGSDDGTIEFLETQPDVHLFSTTDKFSSSWGGALWKNALLDAYATGHWVLNLDADELFVFPRYEALGLRNFCAFLDGAGARGVFCLMLDMYSDRPLAETRHPPGAALVETCPYFDRRTYRLLPAETLFPPMQIYGGVRERLFGQHLGDRYRAPMIAKVPLVKWAAGDRYTAATHHMTPVPLADVTGVLLHFKFLSDFASRAAIETARGEHYQDSIEYRAYLELVRDHGLTDLMAEVSARYENSAQLVRMHMMQTSAALEAFAPLRPSTSG